MSDAAAHEHVGPVGTGLLPRDLSEDELAAAPILESVEALVIEELTDEEFDAFVAAVSS